ncbi:hypothetical protein AAZX31_01G155700 [Glycine max]|uniref:Uncharacterized protein n=1 Tax=Glycine max TaxID=3847 RepID=A0A0R0LL37_SOYBN|nr:hypothetical protein GYH30_001835 [Glycine max]KRH76687.1 hypothetical protein GLYMA_01G168300v4 [Glycine max]
MKPFVDLFLLMEQSGQCIPTTQPLNTEPTATKATGAIGSSHSQPANFDTFLLFWKCIL